MSTDDAIPDTQPAPVRNRSRRSRPLARLLLAPVVVLVLAVGSACGDDDDSIEVGDAAAGAEASEGLHFVIPEGSGERIDAGEPVEVLPGELEVEVGDVIVIENEDDRGHLVGPFFVGAGEVLTQRFTSPGEYIGECSVHPSGELVVHVT
jgi:plastocyanin